MSGPSCVECGSTAAVIVTGEEIYPTYRRAWDRPFWRCPCGAYVGCHPGTRLALGRPAGAQTRKARGYVHAMLDPLWMSAERHYPPEAKTNYVRKLARTRCYEWLAARMNLTADECHTGMFTIEQCREAYRLLRGITYSEIRSWAKAERAKAKREERKAKAAARKQERSKA